MRLEGLPKRFPKGPKSNFFSKWQLSSRKNSVDCNLKLLETPDVTSIGLISLGNTTSVLFMYWLVYLVYLIYIWCTWFICLVSLAGLIRLLDYFQVAMPQLKKGFCASSLQLLVENLIMSFYISRFFCFFEILGKCWNFRIFLKIMRYDYQSKVQEESIKTKATIKNESAMIESALTDK